LLGGADKNAVVFNKETEQVIAVLKGHTKKVTSVIYHPSEVPYSNLSLTHLTAALSMFSVASDVVASLWFGLS